MKLISDAQKQNENAQPLSLDRRSFVKGIAALGPGIAASPLFLGTAEAQAPVGPPTSRLISAGRRAKQPAMLTTEWDTVGMTGWAQSAFTGAKTDWHGFDRYDFVIDENTLAITPFTEPTNEKFGVASPERGQRRCIVVVPRKAVPGNPWSWRGCYWDHQPQTEIELLGRGFHITYISADATLKPGKEWDAWYTWLTERCGFSKKPAFIGMSRGGEYAYTWATAHADSVSCIYADNPGMNPKAFMGLELLAENDVPLLHVCGSIDPLLGINSTAIENIYLQFGGRISVMIKEGFAHHPHSLRDPKPIADFIEHSVQQAASVPPAFVSAKSTKSSYYDVENSYRDFPSEGTHITCRGALFTGCYDRYAFTVSGTEGFTTIIVPNTVAPGKPWVFRAGFVQRGAKVDIALLAKGFHIVTAPVGYNADGPQQKDWDTVYTHLTGFGFSKKPVMEGAGGGAGEVYAWAIANPDKVSCIYAENPIMHSNLAKTQPLDDLAPLAKAGVPLLHVCGSLDPGLKDNTLVAEEIYKKLGGDIKVILKTGKGHYPLGPEDLKPVIDRIS
jgi:hypothetical protein